jgi:hypothetical protein
MYLRNALLKNIVFKRVFYFTFQETGEIKISLAKTKVAANYQSN